MTGLMRGRRISELIVITKRGCITATLNYKPSYKSLKSVIKMVLKLNQNPKPTSMVDSDPEASSASKK